MKFQIWQCELEDIFLNKEFGRNVSGNEVNALIYPFRIFKEDLQKVCKESLRKYFLYNGSDVAVLV